MEREKNGLERGQKLVLNGKKNGISPNSTIWNGVERPFFAVPHLSTVFFAVPALFSPVLDDFRQKREKKGRQKMEERERKERVPFQFLSRSHFFPFLSTHISTTLHTVPRVWGGSFAECPTEVIIITACSIIYGRGTSSKMLWQSRF